MKIDKAIEKEPKEITYEDIERYCKERCLTIITNEIYHELTLQQASIIDKIRAEILEEHENAYAREDYDTAYGLSIALDILDKYRAKEAAQ